MFYALWALYLPLRKFVMFNLVLFGPPGSGKGTQSENIISKFGLKHVSTGDLLRAEKKAETPLGLEAKKFMDNGELVPDEVVIGMISSMIDNNADAKGFIFDGFPRTVEQAEALDKLLAFKNNPINLVISLEVKEEELIARLIERGKESGRADDNEEVITNRIKQYHEKTAPVAKFYKEQNKLVAVEGVGSIDDIFDAISSKIEVSMA